MIMQLINDVISSLEALTNEPDKPNKKAVIGFDGFVDVILKVVTSDEASNQKEYISSMKDFGEHISTRAGHACAFIMETKELRAGGNAPILSIALDALGMHVTCMGMIGYPQINSLFSGRFSPKASLMSVGEPSISNVLEFDDGKVMMSQLEHIDNLNWQSITKHINIDEFTAIFESANFAGLMNFSETPQIFDIWQGLIDNIIPKLKTREAKKIIGFDLADCSNKSDEEIISCMKYLGEFAKYFRVVLSVNENELNRIYKAYFKGSYESVPPEDKLIQLYEKLGELNISVLSLHTQARGFAVDMEGFYETPSYYVEKPKILVGAGDNFNAGLFKGLTLGYSVEESLIMGTGVSSFYVCFGKSPNLSELTDYLRKWLVD